MNARKRSPRGSGEQLADEILDAADSLLIERGSADALSIRAVAERVGVTPPSIYLHFTDKEALLDAVCARYFERFDGVMMAAAAGLDDPRERALAQGLAYVRFALGNREIFQVTFSRVTPPGAPTLTDEVLLGSAFTNFSDTVRELRVHGLLPDDEAEVTGQVLQLWSAAHGIAALMIARPGLPWGDDLALAERMLKAVCDGLGQPSVSSEPTRPDRR